LAARDRRLLKPTNSKSAPQIDEDDSDEEEDAEMNKIREMVREWKAEAARDGRPLKLPTSMRYSLSNTVWADLSALYAPQYLDGRTRALWPDHGLHLLHH
jgi:solute carrier family 45 protein 1/2/4